MLRTPLPLSTRTPKGTVLPIGGLDEEVAANGKAPVWLFLRMIVLAVLAVLGGRYCCAVTAGRAGVFVGGFVERDQD